VRIGARALIAAYTYFVGGDHLHDRVDIPILDQGRTAQGIDVGDHAWLGAHVVVTDGVRIGRDAIIGAGAIVRENVPDFHVAAGVPAKVIKDRRHGDSAAD
jgi:acetyltransferase-like isoleucine patch superfamily enzyme